MFENRKFRKSKGGVISLVSKKTLITRAGFWLIIAFIALGFLGAVQWDHPQSSIVAKIFGGLSLLSLFFAFLSYLRKDSAKCFASLAMEVDEEGIIIADSKGKVIYTNPASQKFLSVAANGKSNSSLEKISDFKFQFSGAEAEGVEKIERLISDALDGRSAETELIIPNSQLDPSKVTKDRTWFNIRVDPMKRNHDKYFHAKHMILRVSDVTVAREIEKVRIEEHKRTSDLIDFLPIGTFSADGDGIILYANQTLARWLGKPPEYLIGTAFGEYVAGVGENGSLYLKDGEGRNFLAKLEQTHKETLDGDVAYTRSIIISDALWEGEHFSSDLGSMQASSKSFISFNSERLQDVSETFRSLKGLFDQAPIGMVLLDLNGNVTDANQAFLKMLDLNYDAILNKPFTNYLAREDHSDLTSSLSKLVMETATAAHIEVRMPGAGAREFTLSLYASRLADIDSEASDIILYLIDNTEQKNLEVQFAQSQKMQAVGQLAGGVAHDFNNLLTAMIGFCDLLLTRHGPNDPSFSDLQQIRQNANRATNLVRQLLAFSRKQTLEPVSLDISEALNDLNSLLRRLIGEKVELILDHGRELVSVMGDKSQFDQIIINLCVNARDAMPGGGTITIRTENIHLNEPVQRGHDLMPIGQYVLINVWDTGTGISKENIERIFEPFFSTKEAGAGTGLGLSTVYGIVHQSGGFIFVDSAPGRGTKFSIYLPEFDKPTVASNALNNEVLPSAEKSHNKLTSYISSNSGKSGTEKNLEGDLTGSATVLLVEDEDAVRMFAKRALENKGYTVLEAVNGEMALDVINATDASIDVIVSDVIMPGMDGYTLVGLVRQELPDIKVILMSGYTEDVYREEIGRDGSLHFLGKPFTLKDLAAKVKEALLE